MQFLNGANVVATITSAPYTFDLTNVGVGAYRRSGTLWEGRFRSCLTQTEDYVLACYRYIELNPVRACMVDYPGDYRWSSYPGNALGRADPLIVPHGGYVRLGADTLERRVAYRALFDAHLDAQTVRDIRKSTNGNFALGSERFKREIEQALGRRAQQARSGRPRSDDRNARAE